MLSLSVSPFLLKQTCYDCILGLQLKKRTTCLCGSSKSKYVVVLVRSDQFHLPRFQNCMSPFIDQELTIDTLDVELNRIEAEEKLLPNIFIGFSCSQEPQHFE